MNLGYACINMELNARKGVDRVTTNRSMIKKNFPRERFRLCVRIDYTKCC